MNYDSITWKDDGELNPFFSCKMDEARQRYTKMRNNKQVIYLARNKRQRGLES